MPSIKDLKKRIGTVKNTQQTTKAMKMVSAAKLRRAQDAITFQRPFARQIGGLMARLAAMPEVGNRSPLLGREAPEGGKRVLLVLVSSDRGLCGGFNGNVIKTAQRWMASNGGAYQSVSLAFVGRKAFDIFKIRKVQIARNYAELSGKVTFAKAKKLSDDLITRYLAAEFDEVKFIYNEFKNAVTQAVVVEDFLPLPAPATDAEAALQDSAVLVEPSPVEVFDALLERHFSMQAYRILLESQAGEHGARMSAMENATKNAGEMIRKLTLQYNKQRQAGITKELLEIIAGSESQKVE